MDCLMFEKCSWIFEGFCGAFGPLSKSPPSSWGAGSVNTYTWQLWVSSRPEVKLPPNVAKIRKVFFRFLTHFYVSSISCQVSDKQQISDGSHIMFYSALDPASGKLRDYCTVKRATPRSCMYGAIFGSEATKSPRNTTNPRHWFRYFVMSPIWFALHKLRSRIVNKRGKKIAQGLAPADPHFFRLWDSKVNDSERYYELPSHALSTLWTDARTERHTHTKQQKYSPPNPKIRSSCHFLTPEIPRM